MDNLCGADCSNCGFKDRCAGCRNTCGNPFGCGCLAAEYINIGGTKNFNEFKKKLIDEINMLHIEGLPEVKELFTLSGFYVNLSYPLPNGNKVKFINDNRIYLGCQLENEFDDGKGESCFGIIADKNFILVAEYGINGTNPEIVLFKRR